MFRLIKNDDGIALMMVLVLLILVGGLTASLMAAGVFNIRFSGDEVDRTQAFYAADAGVEYMKSWVRNTDPMEVLDTVANENNNGDNILFISENSDGWVNIEEGNNDLRFRIKLADPDEDGDTKTFISEGKYNNQNTSQIKFSFDLDDGLINDIMFLINQGMYTSIPDAVDDNGNLGYDHFNFIDTIENWNHYSFNYDFHNSKYFDQNPIPQSADNFEINRNTFYSNNIVIGEDDETEFDDSELKISGGATIKDSIVAIDGNFRTSGGADAINFENSLVLVRGEFNFGGSLNLDNSMIISFNEGKESNSDTSMTVRGGSSLTTEPITDINEFYSILAENDDYDTHKLAKDILDGYFSNLEIYFENIVFNSDWRQVR